MSYCRFQNTLNDLIDCKYALAEISNLDELSSEEEQAARRLLKLCRLIADDWDADATPALALCAAALRARAASGMEAHQGGNEVPSRSDDSPARKGDAQ